MSAKVSKKAKAAPVVKVKSAPASTGEKQGSKATQFKSGQSGNPAGRPRGSRDKINADFIAAMCADFEEHGVNVIQKVREEKPDAYLKVVAGLLPKEVNFNNKTVEELTDDEIMDALDTIRSFKAESDRGTSAAGEGTASGAQKRTRPARIVSH